MQNIIVHFTTKKQLLHITVSSISADCTLYFNKHKSSCGLYVDIIQRLGWQGYKINYLKSYTIHSVNDDRYF